jgi:hypothetical protein
MASSLPEASPKDCTFHAMKQKTWEQLSECDVEQVHLDASGKLLILKIGELPLSENGDSGRRLDADLNLPPIFQH